MTSADWSLSRHDTETGEWFRWDAATAGKHPGLAAAVADFEAHGGKNAEAAARATAWLKDDALREAACVTRILVANGHVAAFYALASGEMILTSAKKLERLGIQGGQRVGSSHVEWIARDRRAHAGAGWLAVEHAIDLALRYVSRLQGNRVVTMDSYDQATQEMWRARGLRLSQSGDADGLRRLYIPLFGVDYGSLSRAADRGPETG
ncbi:MAG TPA: hypothetical protein VN238_21940 [Solirubrobacteraceae bacterium]|nr:hypothetical protein [Solirubrobacteraceae bacterium]